MLATHPHIKEIMLILVFNSHTDLHFISWLPIFRFLKRLKFI